MTASPRRPVLFASAAHPGHINPLVAIAAELSRRGVSDLWFASEEDARRQVEQTATGSPIGFLTYGENVIRVDEATYAAMTRGPRTTAGLTALVRLVRNPLVTEHIFHRTVEQIDQIRPQLMVIDVLNVGALDAATIRQVPFVLSVPFPISAIYFRRLRWDYPTPYSGLPRRMNLAQKLANMTFRVRIHLSILASLDLGAARRRRAEGIDNVFADVERYSSAATAVFAYSVFGLEYPFAAPAHLHMLGTMVPVPSGTVKPAQARELTGWLDRHESVVYVCMGTLAQLSAAQLGTLADALGRIGPIHRVLWKLPADQRALLPRSLPAHIRVEEWVHAQSEVLAHPHVRAVVCHGGANILHESIHFGQPVLVMPFWLDCYDLAARAVDAGVGLTLDRPPQFDADEVATKLRRLLFEDSFRQRGRYWGEQLHRAGGVGRAADLVSKAAGLVSKAAGEEHDDRASRHTPGRTASR